MPSETIIALCISLCSVLFAALSYRRNTTHDTEDAATERAKMNANILYIRDAIDEIKLEYRGIKKDIDEMQKQIIKVEQSVASAHKRLDELKKGE